MPGLEGRGLAERPPPWEEKAKTRTWQGHSAAAAGEGDAGRRKQRVEPTREDRGARAQNKAQLQPLAWRS